VNLAQLFTLDKPRLMERLGKLPTARMQTVETGIRLVLAL
jgi:mRNA-degrading endonuclease toxin of MazEF toxin-antitoxin module